MKRLLAACAASLILAAAGPAARADVRRQGPDVRTASYEGVIADIYPDKSFWLMLPYRSQSLYLNGNGSTILFDGGGQTIAEGKWDAAAGTVEGLGGLPADLVTKVNSTLAYIKRLPKTDGPPAGSSSGKGGGAAPKTPSAIEWVDEKH
ncbi:MAG TPA: hypothetical protein VL404_08940 [Candidatus Eisenbacteria bacterium]|nr:hypothetical protein [Candidatus Eisenbacteria bacterium]